MNLQTNKRREPMFPEFLNPVFVAKTYVILNESGQTIGEVNADNISEAFTQGRSKFGKRARAAHLKKWTK